MVASKLKNSAADGRKNYDAKVKAAASAPVAAVAAVAAESSAVEREVGAAVCFEVKKTELPSPLRARLWNELPQAVGEMGEPMALQVLGLAMSAAAKLEPQERLSRALWAFGWAQVEKPSLNKPAIADCKAQDMCRVLTAVGADTDASGHVNEWA